MHVSQRTATCWREPSAADRGRAICLARSGRRRRTEALPQPPAAFLIHPMPPVLFRRRRTEQEAINARPGRHDASYLLLASLSHGRPLSPAGLCARCSCLLGCIVQAWPCRAATHATAVALLGQHLPPYVQTNRIQVVESKKRSQLVCMHPASRQELDGGFAWPVGPALLSPLALYFRLTRRGEAAARHAR